ncbi:MAG: Asp-tRNA(Asn)/Glu-tRNA(Gln) amidotransferase subunit GatC [Candidatus Omnitrophica bacterium]|nr:Asp-tRNA(Asn)/Glu-tRNA(Gln) amidotransferase subunit GatC [Candidatus Omnitrophota bacterium]
MSQEKIDKKTVEKVALLSRLTLKTEDIDKFSWQLNSILGYIDKLKEVDTENVLPTTHTVGDIKNVFREDVVKKSLDIADVLKNAPQKIGNFFGVPKVIE